MEQSLDSVRREVKRRGIDWPVAVDNHYEIWQAFSNNYWPALYFGDREGVIRHHHFGEGQYEQSERVIQQLLDLTAQDLVTVEGEGDEAMADWARLNSPETYLGYERTGNLASPDRLELNQWALSGDWTTERERVSLNAAGGRIFFRFQARDVHIVLRRTGQGEPVPFHVLLDGENPAPPMESTPTPMATAYSTRIACTNSLREPGNVKERTFEITFHAGGVEAYVFTFG